MSFFSKSKGEGAKYFGKGFKRTKKNNGSGKKFARRSSSGKVTKNNGSQYNSVVSGGNSSKRSKPASGSKGNPLIPTAKS